MRLRRAVDSAWLRLVSFVAILIVILFVGSSALAAPDTARASRLVIESPAGAVATTTTPAANTGTSAFPRLRPSSRVVAAPRARSGPRLAAKALATSSDEAVFWSGIRGGADTASRWAASKGGATLESTMASRGVKLPAWDPSNPSSVVAWRSASKDFAAGARGNVRVLQDDAVRVNSIWAQVEYPALRANRRVTSITAVNPRTGATKVLWSR